MSAVRRRLTGAVLALLAVAGLAVAAPAGTPGGPTSAAAAVDAAAGVTVLIDEISPQILRAGEDLTVAATVRNDTGEPLENVRAAVRINRFRPASRAELDAWVNGSGGAVGSRVVVGDPLSLAPGGSAGVTLTVPADQVRLLDLPGTWGPRGLAVEAIDDLGRQVGVQRTFLLWMRDETVPQVRVSVFAPVTGLSTTADDLTAATAPGSRLDALADLAAEDRDLELAVDPALLAAASGGGPQALAWADAMAAALALREGYALPWQDTDLAAVAHAGRPELLAAGIELAGQAGLAGTPARTDVMWAPDGRLDQLTAGAVAQVGARAIVVGPNTLQAKEGVTPARVDLDTASGSLVALVPDHVLTNLLVDPSAVEAGATTATTVQRLLAELAVLAHDGSTEPHHVLIAPGRTWQPDEELTLALLDALRSSPWSRLVSASALLGTAEQQVERDELPGEAAAPQALSPADVVALAEARDSTLQFAAAIGGADSVTADLDQRVLVPLAVAYRDDRAARRALVEGVVSDAATAQTGLTLIGSESLNVISSLAPVRFVVRNDLEIPATVAVQVSPRKACLRPAVSEPVDVAPGEEMPVVVDLEAVANCDVVVDAMLVGADGTEVSDAIRFTARVAPAIESVGTVVVMALLGIGLVLGIVRTARRGRSARRVPKVEA